MIVGCDHDVREVLHPSLDVEAEQVSSRLQNRVQLNKEAWWASAMSKAVDSTKA